MAGCTKRFEARRLAGFYSRHIGQVSTVLNPQPDALVPETTCTGPKDGAAHWSIKRLSEHLGVSRMMVARVWRQHGLKPHRLERYMAPNDPDFESKAASVNGLYPNPPVHMAIFCADEKTHNQALGRKDLVLPLSQVRLERHGFEYHRHGTLSLCAAFNTQTDEVLGKTASRHTSAEFLAFLTDIVLKHPRRHEIRVIAENLSSHKTEQVNIFLAEHPNVQLYFNPTHSSCFNQME